MPAIIFNQLIFIIICAGYGIFFSKIFNLKKIFKNLNIFDVSIFGLIFLGFFGQISNFFIPLNDVFLLINFFLSIFLILYFYKEYKSLLFFDKKIVIIILITLMLTYLKIYGSGFSDDLAHYHYSSINNTDNLKYIIGLNHLHNHFWILKKLHLNFQFTFAL